MHICAIQKALEKVVQWHEGELQYYYLRCGRDDHIRYTPPLLTRYSLSEVYCNVITDRNRVYRTLVELELAVTNWLELVSECKTK